MRTFAIILVAAALLFAAFTIGRICGVKHAIEDAEMCIVEFDDPDIPVGYDLRIWIDLDGQSYEHFAYIG